MQGNINKIAVITLGCKVNKYESRQIMSSLKSIGFTAVEGLVPADLYIVNTCSVTNEADAKSRQMLARIAKISSSPIIVCGCSSKFDARKFNRSNVIGVCGVEDKEQAVLNMIQNLTSNGTSDLTPLNTANTIAKTELDKFTVLANNAVSTPLNALNKDIKSKATSITRTYVKIQDGCDRFCSYCIVPYLRGRSKSKPLNEAVEEIKSAADNSLEIVITGVDISDYGKDINSSLNQLLTCVKDVKVRKRFGSLECRIIESDFLNLMKDANFCDHFHLSLQSGSNEVLRRMNRRYSAQQYLEKVELIRSHFPNAGITTDIIVGFPTETDEQFIESLNFVKACKFSDIHVFPYSKRDGTAAAKFEQTNPKTISARVKIMTQLKLSLRDEFIKSQLGLTHRVIFEEVKNGYSIGYTENYIRVYCANAPIGVLVNAKLIECYKDGARVTVIK